MEENSVFPRLRQWGLCNYPLLIAVVVLLYGQTVWFDFLDLDDGHYVYDNPAV